MRKLLVFGILACCAAGICYLMWQEEYRYSLPTPIPEYHEPVPLGSLIPLSTLFPDRNTDRPVFAHFFSPDCPCSRFNLQHFRSLVQAHGDTVNFAVIIPEGASEARAREMLETDIPVLIDHDRQWAIQCGIYATPQAVILDEKGSLFYRGNYNKSRFCTVPGSNFASLSLEALLQGQPPLDWGLPATTAYGCQIPDSSDMPDYSGLFMLHVNP